MDGTIPQDGSCSRGHRTKEQMRILSGLGCELAKDIFQLRR